MQPKWNALYVRHNHEKAASRFLAAHGVVHYLPLYAEQSEWSNRCKVVVERPFFPGYVFVCFTPEQRQFVFRAPGVVCLAGEDKCGAITGAEIELLRKAIAGGYRPQPPHHFGTHAPASYCRDQTTLPTSFAPYLPSTRQEKAVS